MTFQALQAYWPLPLVGVYFILASSLLGRWMLQPINEAGGRVQAPRKFLLTDFAWLVLQLQLALGFSVSWIGVEQRTFAPILAFLMFAVFVLWLFGVGFLSRAGVTQPLRRAIFTTVLLPATLGVMMALPALLVMLVVLESDFTQWGDLAIPLREYSRSKPLLWVVTPTLPVMGWMLRQVSFWVVRERTEPASTTIATKGLKPT
ncbi:hypothetical protein NA78x_000308 [Anatilimnocola sp. NA78]|uniref:hypothetical protein n=1 Tax=Anatilimnocola sp. NA78 TaxID=3415683 RepID=UPI003CE54B29